MERSWNATTALILMPTIVTAPGKYLTRCGETVEVTAVTKGTYGTYGVKGVYPEGIAETWDKSGRIFAFRETKNDIVRHWTCNALQSVSLKERKMTKDQLSQALAMAKDYKNFRFIDGQGRHRVDISIFDGYGLPSFDAVTCTIEQVAALIRWEAINIDGSVRANELNNLSIVARTKFTIIGDETLLEFIAKTEASFFRTDEDTGANGNAMLIWNLVREKAGLGPLTLDDLASFCQECRKYHKKGDPHGKENLKPGKTAASSAAER